MNVLYLIGNGFDLAYGLKTRYADFYEEYVKPDDKDTEDVKKLKKNIRSDYPNWSDLEKAIGGYTVNYNSSSLLEETFYSLKDDLQNYLQGINKSFIPDVNMKEKAKSAIGHPEKLLEEADLIPFNTFSSNLASLYRSRERIIDVVTFNYTHSFEKLFGNQFPLSINANCNIQQLRHIHGDISNTILMGVNDPSQISNSGLRKNEDLMEVMVKPEANDAMRNLSNSQVEDLIKNANLIVLYGLSLGETDKKWWEIIGDQFARDDFRLIYFYFEPDVISPRRRELTRRVYRKCIERIIDTFNIKPELQSKVETKSLIAINKPLFGNK